MKCCTDIEDLVVEEYTRQKAIGNFSDDNWDESGFSIELEPPYPKGFVLKVEPYCDYYDEDNHYKVNIYDRSGTEVVGTSSRDLTEHHLFYAAYQAALRLSYVKWADSDLMDAWKVFCTIPCDNNNLLLEAFLEFSEGTPKNNVLSWFNEKYSWGLSALMDPADPGETLYAFRIPVIREMKDYITVVAKSQNKAVAHIMSRICPQPKGTMIEESLRIDTREAITAEPVHR